MEKLTDNIKLLLDKNENDIRLTKQFLYSPNEEKNKLVGHGDVADDAGIMKIEGLYHRYPSKVLIFPAESCFGECRFCFRKHIRQNKKLAPKDFEAIIKYIEANVNINEVIFSGGDPLTLNNKNLIDMVSRVRKIPSVKIIRIHTRALTYSPERIDEELVNFLAKVQPLFMVFHINSALEIDDIANKKLAMLKDNGISCYSQTALLHGINDTEADLKELFMKLLCMGVKPYYLFHPDRVKGNDHFYIPIKKGIELYKSLFNHISGLATPVYLLNIPNGGGHCLVDLSNIREIEDKRYIITDWNNKKHVYNE